MRKILKRVGAGILALSLIFTPNMSASAYGVGGGAGPSGISSGSAVPGLGTLAGYAFRVYLYEVNDEDDKLWHKINGTNKYKMYQNNEIRNKLDSYGWSSSVYLGLKSKNSYIFDSSHKSGGSKGHYRKVPSKRIISDKKFNKIKGMSNYSSANVQDKEHTNWSTYFKNGSNNKVFNHFNNITDSDKGMVLCQDLVQVKMRNFSPF